MLRSRPRRAGVRRSPPSSARSMTPAYAQANLYPGRFTEEWQPGDVSTSSRLVRSPGAAGHDEPRRYPQPRSHPLGAQLARRRALERDHRSPCDYVWRGETDVRVRWLQVGGGRVLPSVRYELSPHRSGVLRADATIGRSAPSALPTGAGPSESATTGKSVAGFRCRDGRRRGSQPSVTVDAWSHDVEGFGMRGEVGGGCRAAGRPGARR